VTIRIAAFLFCDGKAPDGQECGDFLDYSTIPDARTGYEANAQAKAERWHLRPQGRHICPFCWERGER
jgi:hypothetical protein